MAAPSRNSKNAEVLVLGTSLSGLLIAEAYRQAGHQVTILDPSAHALGALPADLNFYPASESAKVTLDWVQNLLRLELNPAELESGPMHFDEGMLKPFVGFGDRAFPSREELDFYTSPNRFESSVSLNEIIAALVATLAPLTQTRKEVTKLIASEGRVTGVEVNGEEIWTGGTIIATQSPAELLEMLAIDALDGRHRTRLAKGSSWGSVTLQVLHKRPVTLERGIHVLYGSGNDCEPIVGRFYSTQESGQQASVWMTFVPRESSEDTDYMSHTLKHMKRQIRRAYPDALDDLLEEKLVVFTESHGHVAMKTKHPLQVPELSNLTFAHPMFSTFRGPLAAMDIAAKATADISLTAVPQSIQESEVEVANGAGSSSAEVSSEVPMADIT